MYRVLTVTDSEELRLSLLHRKDGDYQFTICADAGSVRDYLREGYDAMVLELELPGVDGIALLEDNRDLIPPVILALTRLVTPYVLQALPALGVGYALRMPCSEAAILRRLEGMLGMQTPTEDPVLHHLRRLRIPPDRDGYRYLRSGIPLFARSEHRRITKELYPLLARQYNVSTATVEHDIRTAIRAGWENRTALWEEYFPGAATCPSNKQFLSVLAEFV